MENPAHADSPHLVRALEPDERVAIRAQAVDAVIAVTDRRMLVATDTRLAMSVPITHGSHSGHAAERPWPQSDARVGPS